jgi:predicted dehydrogenase
MVSSQVGIGVIGLGGISQEVHLPGLSRAPLARIVALCDTDESLLARVATQYEAPHTTRDYQELLRIPGVEAVVIATPTVLHAPIALAAMALGKHVLCEKQLAMDYAEARRMYEAAEQAGVRHQTAFTYRFVPAMRYLRHLLATGTVGLPRFLRIARLMDWPDTDLGWRQHAALAGSGEIGDMGAHRIDFAHDLVGPIARVVATTRTYVPVRAGRDGPIATDVEDFGTIIAEFAAGAGVEQGAVATFSLSKLARGRLTGGKALDEFELYATEGTLIYHLHEPNVVQIGRPDGRLETVPVPREFLTYPGSPRDPQEGEPTVTFRYDQDFAFVQAIAEDRPCAPSFYDGMRCQAVVDAVLQSARERRWVEVEDVPAVTGPIAAARA